MAMGLVLALRLHLALRLGLRLALRLGLGLSLGLRLGLSLGLGLSLVFGFFSPAMGLDLDLAPELKVQIRNQIQSCQTLFVSGEQIEGSVGLPFSTNDPRQLRAELETAI